MGGQRGALPVVGGSKGPEPLASPNVLHWVGWLPGTTRCAAGPAVPASHGPPARRTRAVQWRDLRSLRRKSVQEAFRGVLACQGPGNPNLPGKARGFRGQDTVERHGGFDVVMEHIVP